MEALAETIRSSTHSESEDADRDTVHQGGTQPPEEVFAGICEVEDGQRDIEPQGHEQSERDAHENAIVLIGLYGREADHSQRQNPQGDDHHPVREQIASPCNEHPNAGHEIPPRQDRTTPDEEGTSSGAHKYNV